MQQPPVREWYRNAPAFEAVFGIYPGYYFGLPQTEADASRIVGMAWNEAMMAEHADSKILVTANIIPSRVIYPKEYGCPEGGEIVCTVRGQMISKFMPSRSVMETQSNEEKYIDAVTRVVEAVRLGLKQERVQCAFTNVDKLLYLVPQPTPGKGLNV